MAGVALARDAGEEDVVTWRGTAKSQSKVD